MKPHLSPLLHRIKRAARLIELKTTSLQYLRSSTPALYYGGQVPRKNSVASGGRVKLIALAEKFPEHTRNANLAYWVSSALPIHFGLELKRIQRAKIPLILNQNGVAYPAWAGEQTENINTPLRLALQSASAVLYQSEFCKRSADRFIGATQSPNRVLHNSVDTEWFSPNPGATAPSMKDFVILLGGNQYQRYRLVSALQALQQVKKSIPGARLLISGSLSWDRPQVTEQFTQRLIRELDLGDSVEFLGNYLPSQAPAIYRRAHVLLHTKFNDPCPGAVIEALSCGLPVVGSKSGGMPELVNSNSGVLLHHQDTSESDPDSWNRDLELAPEQWAEGLVSACDQWINLARGAREQALQRFSLKEWLKVHSELFDQVRSGP